ncbi:VPS10 domain-containing receptor SorCS2 [Puma concolor]|uniref:VPS10 domain-containing receptor SorCS2 n=1 Tax=Puma concolor TaxID=9696 RepID=A0A6P6HQ61_PUMCO|nr:VPS10 domain-containing receptor SorCS2 [Puma concolor]
MIVEGPRSSVCPVDDVRAACRLGRPRWLGPPGEADRKTRAPDVYWVILILTKYYHADMGKVLESSLWRSSDFGTSYTKLTLQPGVTTVIDNFYICPTNKRKVVLVSSSLSDRDQSLFLSTDEGATFQKQLVPFSVETLIFHPKEEDKVLAYSKESADRGLLAEVWSSRTGIPEFPGLMGCVLLPAPSFSCGGGGRIQNRGLESVASDVGRLLEARGKEAPGGGGRGLGGVGRFWMEMIGSARVPGARAVSGVDTDPDLVHMETQDLGGGFRYVTCQIHSCSDKTLTALFPGRIDHSSLTVQDDYIFFKATATNRTKYYVSYRRNEFVLMKLPKYALPQVFMTFLVLLSQVRGVKGVFLANQKTNGKVVTLITYNKGRDWDRLRPPSTDMNGKPTNCEPPDCHLHLHLRWADNPYVSGTVHTKDTAPGLIMGAGNLGSQLVEYKEEMYITSDCGHTWRQVFEEEHHVLYLDHGGVIAAIKDTSIPLKILKFSVDEGLTWSTHNFTSTSVFVDGLLSEPGDETLVMTVFGHISFRSDWELVKVDFRPSFSRQCSEDDYGSWHLSDLKGDRCIMGQQRSFRKRKPTSWCVKGKSFTSALEARVCRCRESDFLCDYGFERSPSSGSDANKCFANFWFNPLSPPDDCVLGQTYTSSLGPQWVSLARRARRPAPTLLRLYSSGPRLPSSAKSPGWRSPGQGDVLTTKYQVDLGDGFKAVYVNLTSTEEPIRHRYESPGVYRVSVRAENVAGHDEAVLFVQVNSPLQALHLEVLPVVGLNQEVNLTAVLLPLNPNLTVFYWWIGHSLQPLLSLENSVSTRFADTGDVRVTVQAACGNSVLQDSKVVRVLDQFQVVPLRFSTDLDVHNPNTPEWREDVGLVVTRLLSKETSVPEELLVTIVKPGLPTVADLNVLLPPPGPARKRNLTSDKRLMAIQQVLKAQKISFLLRGGVRILVAMRDTDTDSQRLGGGGGYWAVAVLVVIGLFAVGVFILYKFKRKRPGRTVYAQMHNEKEQEMTSPVSHSQGVQSVIQERALARCWENTIIHAVCGRHDCGPNAQLWSRSNSVLAEEAVPASTAFRKASRQQQPHPTVEGSKAPRNHVRSPVSVPRSRQPPCDHTAPTEEVGG